MDQIYQKIMELKEAEEFKHVIKRWNTLSDNIRTRPTDAPIILPDMLWVARSGVGKTNLLQLTSEYLASKKNLMEFYGDVKFFEFLMSYCPPGSPFSELRRLMDAVDNAAGFRNEFKGIVHIDINEWLDHYEEKHFISFMEYLAAYSDRWMIILSVYSDKKEKIHNLMAFLSMYLRIEKVTLSLPRTEYLFGHIESELLKYGLRLTPDARTLLYDTIEELRKNKYFDGFKTIKMLCQDIVYSIFSERRTPAAVVDAAMLSSFSAHSEYVQRTVANIERVNRIGLINKGNNDEL